MHWLHRVAPFALALASLAPLASTALANCEEVNAGAFDRTDTIFAWSDGLDLNNVFEVGDTVTFTVSGTPGSAFQLRDGNGYEVLLDQPLSDTPVTVSYTVTGVPYDTDLYTYVVVDPNPTHLTIVAKCTPAGSKGAGPDAGETVHAFLTARTNAILSGDPSAISLRNRGAAAAPGGGGADHFLPNEMTSPWNVWADARYSGFGGDLDRNGGVGILQAGGDYRVTDRTIIGMLGQFDWARDETGAAKVEGTGWMIGPYLSTRLHDQIYLDLRAAWGQSSNDLTTDTATGSFGTTRWLVKGTLSGDWIAGAWRMTPSAELAYMNEHAAEFTDSTSTIIPAQDVATGRLQLGTEFGYRIGQNSGALIEPFVGLKGVWDFVNPNGAAGDIRARLQGGLNVTAPSGLSLRALASWDDVGSAYCGYTLQGTLRVPLH